jgi:hypothetical protein
MAEMKARAVIGPTRHQATNGFVAPHQPTDSAIEYGDLPGRVVRTSNRNATIGANAECPVVRASARRARFWLLLGPIASPHVFRMPPAAGCRD